jgi:hypothetical protein
LQIFIRNKYLIPIATKAELKATQTFTEIFVGFSAAFIGLN